MNETWTSLIIRADANTRIGTGHLMRCMALAQSWKARGGVVTFVTQCESKSLRNRLSDEGMQVVTLEQSHPHQLDWEITSQIIRKSSATWVVLDGYQFDPEYHNQLKKSGQRLLVIDDTAHLNHYCADIILNQNIGADRLKYSHEPYTNMMLGPQYALLRSEFLTWQGWKRKIPDVVAKVLVTMGGADYHNATLKVINALKRVDCPRLEVKIVAGASNPNIEMLKEAVHSASCTMSILSDVRNMANLMAWADMAVTAAGSTCWELSFMKLPFAAILLAENQKYIYEEVEKVGIAIRCGWYYTLNPKSLEKNLFRLIHDNNCRSRMSAKAGKFVDGFGADRVLDALEEVI
jgi:UDP-2,4-diacetamido-2,4,6-trideoxy-beta-L-altropyranose hydrolase